MKSKYLFVFFALFSLHHSYANNLSSNEPKLGTRNNPLKMIFIPSGQASKALENGNNPFVQCVEKKAKIFIDAKVSNNYITVAEAIGSKKADLAFGDIMSFLIAHKHYGAKPFLEITRFGATSYKSAIFVKANSKINSIQDLNNKKFAYSDKISASSYIYPFISMKKYNIKLAQELAAGSMDNSISALMQGQVDAAAAYYNNTDPVTKEVNDARIRVKGIYKDIFKDTRIIWLSKAIPNEPVFIRAGVSESLEKELEIVIPECIKKYPKYINNISELNPIKADNKIYDDLVNDVENSGLEDISNIFKKK